MNTQEPVPRNSRLENALGVVLRGALSNAVAMTRARWGTICMDDPGAEDPSLPSGSVYLHSEATLHETATDFPEACRRCSLLRAGHRRCAPHPLEVVPIEGEPLPCGSNAVLSLGWQPAGTLGVLTLRLPTQCCGSDALVDLGAAAARRISHQLRRFLLARRMEAALSRRSLLVGTTESLDPVDEFLARAARVKLPAVVHGEPGVQKEFVAMALHVAGTDPTQPFVHLTCPGVDPNPAELKARVCSAVGGTLFLDGVDELDPELQATLSRLLDTELGVRASRWDEPAARLVASCRAPLATAAGGTFHPALRAQLDWLSVAVPPLRQRREDLVSLLAYLLLEHDRSDLWLSPRAFESLAAYSWPGNVAELDRLVVRLALMVDEDVVRRKHLVLHAPQIPASSSPVRLGNKQVPPDVVELAGELVEQQFDSLGDFHPGLRKALHHLAKAGQRRLSLKRLARHACLSPSHLSHVFRCTLGMSFKPFLTLYRVEVARKLLEQDPYVSITRVAEEAGFGDLSQLERGFKPIVGCTPRAYRRSLRH